MPASESRITPEYARLLVRLAQMATALSDPRRGRTALSTFAKQLHQDPVFRGVATRSVHYLRLLRLAQNSESLRPPNGQAKFAQAAGPTGS